jgi:hypothetical protein
MVIPHPSRYLLYDKLDFKQISFLIVYYTIIQCILHRAEKYICVSDNPTDPPMTLIFSVHSNVFIVIFRQVLLKNRPMSCKTYN